MIDGIKASLCVFCAFDKNELIGLIRVVGDGFTIIYIQDILVKKEYQRQGIGSKLLQMTLNYYKNIRQKVLMTDNQMAIVAFYEKHGFRKMNDLNLVGFFKVE